MLHHLLVLFLSPYYLHMNLANQTPIGQPNTHNESWEQGTRGVCTGTVCHAVARLAILGITLDKSNALPTFLLLEILAGPSWFLQNPNVQSVDGTVICCSYLHSHGMLYAV